MITVLRETHETPLEVAEAVTRAGGRNIFGEPNFRVVWGRNRLGWIGGRWVDRDRSENVIAERIGVRLVEKYLPLDRWHVEGWLPADAYGSPEAWYRQTMETVDGIEVPALGPYPYRGEYEHLLTLEGPAGEFVQLNPRSCAYVVTAIAWGKRQPAQGSRQAIYERAAREERAEDARMDAILNDASPAFSGQPMVTVL